MQLRFAVPSDAGALLRIYDEYINTSITFEYALPGEAEFAARIAGISAEYPYLALFDGGVPAAYAYAHRAQARAAYGWNAELSIYIAQAYAGHGLGRLLYEALMELLRRQGVKTVYGVVTSPNPASEALHRALGFHVAARFHDAGRTAHGTMSHGSSGRSPRTTARRSPSARSVRSARTKCSTCASRRSANGSQNKKMPRGLR